MGSDLEQRLDEARKLEKRGRGLPIGGKANKMGLLYPATVIPSERKAADEAYDKRQNMREEDVEVLQQRLKESRGYKKGGAVKSSASRRGDGIAQRGKTRGKMV